MTAAIFDPPSFLFTFPCGLITDYLDEEKSYKIKNEIDCNASFINRVGLSLLRCVLTRETPLRRGKKSPGTSLLVIRYILRTRHYPTVREKKKKKKNLSPDGAFGIFLPVDVLIHLKSEGSCSFACLGSKTHSNPRVFLI